MNMKRIAWLNCVILLGSLVGVAAGAAEQKAMPKEDMVEVPAIGHGLCVANVFQSNMVLQRDKQNRITRCLECLPRYGGAAKPLLPQLRQMEKDMRAHREAESLRSQIESLNTIIKNIESDAGTVELRSLE
jgi:hypothetical protein